MDLLIVGAGQGIGAGLREHYSKAGHRVFTTSYRSFPSMNGVSTSYFLDYNQVEECVSFLLSKLLAFDASISLVYFCAAKTDHESPKDKLGQATFRGDLESTLFSSYLKVNCFGPIYLYEKIF
jgi:NAD(P)-dependent dehydrogenase (short-subunit alcohol dehydrogenase family)